METTFLNDTDDLGNHTGQNDLMVGMRATRVWGTLGWHDIRQRYRRSILGPFWFTLSTIIMVGVLGALYSTLLHQEIADYLPYLAVGLVVWAYLAAVANEGCLAFIGAAYLIKQIRLPLTVHVCRIAWRNFVILLHSLPVVVVLLLAFGHWPTWEFLLVPFALVMLFLHGVWLSAALGILCARFRDIPPIITNLIQVVFFFTPVMWSPEILKDRAWVAEYNPLYHLIETVRAPLTGRPTHWESWAWSAGLLVFGFAFAHFLMKRFRNRVPYWL
ncbi:ABC transporter permease [Burkholderia diffusa]|uniref:ABC transporter permease n=1 Tax=Burkholderia diffusa TaxID=488732 RepID=A0AAW3PKL7_9BURK|nr:ABC transporter permease [Burkholderia diffusa]KVG31613.1 ABC transporter permease [Burkholderia diffusa]KVH47200.1 ABC transporter permease [Burkholderia diffusa]KVM93756.1 ABC transporter permease [Burkholderia diffusa]KWF27808.1 ABC transporter permease [Burkholderia diffusa]KWF31610.1 ABC transporter permease [Burkholderia diffusa]